MKHVLPILALAAAASLVAGCASAEPSMGPQSARYITSTHRRAFQERLEANAGAQAAAAEAARRAAQARTATEVAVTVEESAITAPPPPPPPAPVIATPAPAPATAAKTAPPKPVELRSIPTPRPKFELPPGREVPEAPKWPRRFVRMRIVGISAGSADSDEVRSQIEAVRGVREVVINSRTGTAIVVVDTNVDPANVLRAVKPPYSANLIR